MLTPLTLTLLFCVAAGWTVFAAALGGFFALYCAHIGKTGAHPIPKTPSFRLFRARPADEDDEPTPAPAPRQRVGP